jgi:ABC-type Mn2+/Zn2+ transport system ATPase subunit
MSAPLLVVDDLAAGYGGAPVLEGVSFALEHGRRIGVLGPNGGGKSTLFKTLLGELQPVSGGFVAVGGFGYVPQTERSRLDYPVSALDVALMGTLSRLPWWRRPGRAGRAAALAGLGRVGLAELAGAQFGELSGGQRQRVLVARALVQDAPILLLDEPFTGVDQPSAELLEQLLVDLAGEGRGILIATHDVDQVRAWDSVLCLNRRQIAFGPPDATLDRSVLEQTYGGSIVAIPGEGGGLVGILPAHHHHHDEG